MTPNYKSTTEAEQENGHKPLFLPKPPLVKPLRPKSNYNPKSGTQSTSNLKGVDYLTVNQNSSN
jgi:hypothetical protein